MQRLNRLLSLVIFAIVALGAAPASAGDRALVEVIGFSEDGRYFAFEEFGIQDGSGFAYTTTYVIDLPQDRWVVGTPINLQANDASETLHQLRSRARLEARPRLDDLDIFLPAQVAAAIGDGVPDNDGYHLDFGLPGFTEPGSVVGKYHISLKTYDAPAGSPCGEWFDREAKGFTLSIEDFGVSRETHRDRTLPRSRGCPLDYRIRAVYLPFQATDISRSVAIISVFKRGFEGSDRRFVAVPLAFSF